MKLENQLVNLKLSKRMKELGFEQESLFYWRHFINPMNSFDSGEYEIVDKEEVGDYIFYSYSAYTVAELGEMFEKIGADLFIKAYGEVFNFKGTGMVGLLGVINLMRKPDMSAKMLIYLKENNLI